MRFTIRADGKTLLDMDGQQLVGHLIHSGYGVKPGAEIAIMAEGNQITVTEVFTVPETDQIEGC